MTKLGQRLDKCWTEPGHLSKICQNFVRPYILQEHRPFPPYPSALLEKGVIHSPIYPVDAFAHLVSALCNTRTNIAQAAKPRLFRNPYTEYALLEGVSYLFKCKTHLACVGKPNLLLHHFLRSNPRRPLHEFLLQRRRTN